MTKNYLFTSESVTEGHPDKMADQISDAILDYIIERDPTARVACETMLSNGYCIIGGEIKTQTYAPLAEIAREVIREIGYTDASFGFDYRSAGVLNGVGEQSPDIAQGVDHIDGELGAGDQGMMFGYACDETPELMPMAITLAHKLAERLSIVRKNGTLPYLRPDGKTQVTLEYDGDKIKRVHTIIISSQHSAEVPMDILKEGIVEDVIKPIIPKDLLDKDTIIHINPTGRFVIGGPAGDTGLTGRKIIVDTYGGVCPHGGGAFSGKDPTKVDRSGAYMARYIAKNLVASGICKKATIQISYAIGISEPVSVMVNTHNTSTIKEELIEECVKKVFPLTPSGIIKELDLLRPIYRKTASYGHFGRAMEEFSWEKTDKIDKIKVFLKQL
ncbi:MAG: methionine adenosyltransferase [Arcobacteraceae bacterium]